MGYQSKKQQSGKITLFISNIWKYTQNFDLFVEVLQDTICLERICLERAFQKIRMKNRCNPCKMERFAMRMRYWENN